MPLSRAGVPVAARAGFELLQPLFQSARGAHVADLLAARPDEALRFSELDEFGEAGVVCGGVSADDFALSADFSGAGEAAASGGWAVVPRGVFGAGGEKALTKESIEVHRGAAFVGNCGRGCFLRLLCVFVSALSSRLFCWRAAFLAKHRLQPPLQNQQCRFRGR